MADARLQGFVMEEKDRSRPSPNAPVSPAATAQWRAAGITLPVLLALIAWRGRRRTKTTELTESTESNKKGYSR